MWFWLGFLCGIGAPVVLIAGFVWFASRRVPDGFWDWFK
jgi:hypothetical protein